MKCEKNRVVRAGQPKNVRIVCPIESRRFCVLNRRPQFVVILSVCRLFRGTGYQPVFLTQNHGLVARATEGPNALKVRQGLREAADLVEGDAFQLGDRAVEVGEDGL